MTSPERSAPLVVCAGLAVIDHVFAIERPSWGAKARATAFTAVVGGCAANGTVAISRLGGRARLVATIGGPPGTDRVGDEILAWLAREHVDCAAVMRLPGVTSPISSILVDRAGERSIVTYRDPHFVPVPPASKEAERLVADAKALMVDDHLPDFVLPLAAAARRRGIPVVMDIERNHPGSAELRAVSTHLVFSAEGARELAGTDNLDRATLRLTRQFKTFVAVTNGSEDMRFCEGDTLQQMPTITVSAIDTLAAGDVFHAAFALALAEQRTNREALRFASAVAALKCTRFGGIAGTPTRAELEDFLKGHAAA